MGRATLSSSQPSLQQNLGGVWEHACSWFLVMSVEGECGLEPECPVSGGDTARTFRGQTQRPGWLLCGASVPVLQHHRGQAHATVSSFPKWEHTAAFTLLPLTSKIYAEVDGLGHTILLCGMIPGAALLSLRVPSLKGAIQPVSK